MFFSNGRGQRKKMWIIFGVIGSLVIILAVVVPTVVVLREKNKQTTTTTMSTVGEISSTMKGL